MKSFACFLIFTITCTITSFSQITTTPVASKVEETTSVPYDSTENFLGANVKAYIGQELYLNGKAEILRKYGYEGFSLNYHKETVANKTNVYKCCDGFNSKYTDLAGKYFTVLDVIKHPKASQNELLYGKKFYLKLKEKASGDVVYYQYSSEYKHSFPFLIVGYFVKLKESVSGKTFVVRGKNWLKSGPMTDIKTGLPVSHFEAGNIWKAIDLTIDEEYYSLCYLIQNDKGETISLPIESADKEHWVFKGPEADKYVAKYGAETWKKILEGTVQIGMTKEMCKLSWGNPKSVNETITAGKTSEQWVYEKNYLYFENSVLTAIQ
jgi:hypothetical protein